MKHLYTLLLIILTTFSVTAQDSVKHWTPSAIVGINLSQLSLNNWTQGGENSLAWTFTGNGGYKYAGDEWKFDNNLKLAYGRTKIGGDDYRTTDNELYLESIISKVIAWEVDPYFSNTIRTSISTGFNYKVTPSQTIADFFDPGYITQSLGFLYSKSDIFKFRLGVAVQEVITNKFRQYSDDPDTKDKVEAFKLETGIESVTSTEYGFYENMVLKSSLRLFSRFESLDVWDVRWDNTIAAKVNNFINVNLSWLLIYEKAQSPKTQLKEALQLGFTFILL